MRTLVILSLVLMVIQPHRSTYDKELQMPRTLRSGEGVWFWPIAFSSNGRRLAVGINEQRGGKTQGQVLVFDTTNGRQQASVDAGPNIVESVAFAPDGVTVAIAMFPSGGLVLWNTTTGQTRQLKTEPEESAAIVAFSADGKTLAARYAQIVRLWDFQSGTVRATFSPLTGSPEGMGRTLAFSGDGEKLATAPDITPDAPLPVVEIWSGTTSEKLGDLNVGTSKVAALAFTSDGSTLGVACLDGTVSLWDSTKRERILLWKAQNQPITSICFSADGKLLATGSAEGLAKVWETRTHELKQTCSTTGSASVALSADGKTLATTSAGPVGYEVKLWPVK